MHGDLPSATPGVRHLLPRRQEREEPGLTVQRVYSERKKKEKNAGEIKAQSKGNSLLWERVAGQAEAQLGHKHESEHRPAALPSSVPHSPRSQMCQTALPVPSPSAEPGEGQGPHGVPHPGTTGLCHSPGDVAFLCGVEANEDRSRRSSRRDRSRHSAAERRCVPSRFAWVGG